MQLLRDNFSDYWGFWERIYTKDGRPLVGRDYAGGQSGDTMPRSLFRGSRYANSKLNYAYGVGTEIRGGYYSHTHKEVDGEPPETTDTSRDMDDEISEQFSFRASLSEGTRQLGSLPVSSVDEAVDVAQAKFDSFAKAWGGFVVPPAAFAREGRISGRHLPNGVYAPVGARDASCYLYLNDSLAVVGEYGKSSTQEEYLSYAGLSKNWGRSIKFLVFPSCAGGMVRVSAETTARSLLRFYSNGSVVDPGMEVALPDSVKLLAFPVLTPWTNELPASFELGQAQEIQIPLPQGLASGPYVYGRATVDFAVPPSRLLLFCLDPAPLSAWMENLFGRSPWMGSNHGSKPPIDRRERNVVWTFSFNFTPEAYFHYHPVAPEA